ncbi:hypothetical protein A6R68_18813, partial [Neotoma lepida]
HPPKGKSCYLHHSSEEEQGKLLLAVPASVATENPNDACVISSGNTGQWAVLKAPQIAGDVTPGTFFHQIQEASWEMHFSVGWLPHSLECELPLAPSSGHARSATSTPALAFTAAATTTHSQTPTTHKQLQLPSARPCNAHILCSALLHSNIQPHTSLSSSADLAEPRPALSSPQQCKQQPRIWCPTEPLYHAVQTPWPTPGFTKLTKTLETQGPSPNTWVPKQMALDRNGIAD